MQGFRDVRKLIGAFVAATAVGFVMLVYGPNTPVRGIGWGIAVIGALGGLVMLGAFAMVGGWAAIVDLMSLRRPLRAVVMLATAAISLVLVLLFTGSV